MIVFDRQYLAKPTPNGWDLLEKKINEKGKETTKKYHLSSFTQCIQKYMDLSAKEYTTYFELVRMYNNITELCIKIDKRLKP